MTLAGYNLQDNVYIYSNNKCMCVFLISPVPIAEPLTSELIDTPVFYNLAPRPIKYRVSVPIPKYHTLNINLRSTCSSTHFVRVLESNDGHVAHMYIMSTSQFRTIFCAVTALSQWIFRKLLYKEECLTFPTKWAKANSAEKLSKMDR